MDIKGKTKVCAIVAIAMLFSTFTARADGEQVENGAVWVDPVEHFHLQDITKIDCQRDYDEGDIDFNKVLKRSGEKVYGLRLKPIALAGHIEKFPQFNDVLYIHSQTCDYDDVMGIRGVSLQEPAFCIYADEPVNRTYSASYHTLNYSSVKRNDTPMKFDFEHVLTIDINNLRLSPRDGGVGFLYSARSSDTHAINQQVLNPRVKKRLAKMLVSEKTDGDDDLLSHFIYFEGDRHLLAVIGVDNMPCLNAIMEELNSDDIVPNRENITPSEEEKEYCRHPWARIYFEVEEIMIKPGADAALSSQDKSEIIDFGNDLFTWLLGEGDLLGLGEHTPAKESVVINTIATIAAILLGGLGGFVGGSGAQVVANLTNIINGGGGGEMPPIPDTPSADRIPPRRPEDEQDSSNDGGTPSPPPDDSKLFHPTERPDLCEKYIREDAEGTITVTDPATGKKTEYYPTENGEWVRYYGDTNPQTSAMIEEQVRFSAENSDHIKYVADKAKQNLKEQRESNKHYEAKEREEYLKWKDANEKALEKEIRLDHLALKYNTTVDKLKIVLKQNRDIALIESNHQMRVAKEYDSLIKKAELVDNSCEFVVNVMGECVPGGRAVKNAYTFAKSTLVAASEAVNSNMSVEEGLAHIVAGTGKGALGVIQNQAGNLTKNPLAEYAITVSTEMVKDGMTIYEKEGDWSKTIYGMINSGGKKTGDFLLGKFVSGGIHKIKTGATQSLSNKIIPIDKDAGLRMKPETAKKVLTFFNTRTTSMGKIDPTGLLSTKATEAASKFGLHDWEGQTAEGLTKDAVNLKKDLANFKQALIKRANEYGKKYGRQTDKR